MQRTIQQRLIKGAEASWWPCRLDIHTSRYLTEVCRPSWYRFSNSNDNGHYRRSASDKTLFGRSPPSFNCQGLFKAITGFVKPSSPVLDYTPNVACSGLKRYAGTVCTCVCFIYIYTYIYVCEVRVQFSVGTSKETTRTVRDVHLDFHTAPELWTESLQCTENK